MRIYFSGNHGVAATPERLIGHLKPYVMVTFYELRDKTTERESKEIPKTK